MSRRALAIILFISLAVNVFLIGAVVGGLVVGQRIHHQRPAMVRGGQPLWAAANELPPEQRRAYRRLLRGEGGEMRARMAEVRAARGAAWRGLGAEPIDPAAVKRELNAARAREMAIRGGVEEHIVDFAAGLSPAERARLVDGLTRGPAEPVERGQMRDRPREPRP